MQIGKSSNDRKHTSRYCLTLGSELATWSSNKWNKVALIDREAKYGLATSCIQAN